MSKLRAMRDSVISQSFKLLPKADQKKMFYVACVQIVSGLFDLIAVGLIGAVGALAVTGVQSGAPSGRVNQLLTVLRLQNLSFQSQVLTLTALATVILVVRTLFTITFTRRILSFLSIRGAEISSKLISKYLNQNVAEVESNKAQEVLYSLTYGVSVITLGILGSATTMISDLAVLAILTIGLVAIDPIIGFMSITLFSGVALLLYKILTKRTQKLGENFTHLTIEINEKILQSLMLFRELFVRNRRVEYSDQIHRLRLGLSNSQAELQFLPNISKYILETTVVLGGVIIAGIQFAIQDATQATATLAVFLAAGTRIAPAIMRVQQGALQIQSSKASAEKTLTLERILRNAPELVRSNESTTPSNFQFVPDVRVDKIEFTYAEATSPCLNQVDFSVEAGSKVAIVGPSGAGKSTLVDLILGLLNPDSGEVLISGMHPQKAIRMFPGAIAYVPQEVVVTDGTFRSNVLLGFTESHFGDAEVWDALEFAQLSEYVKKLPEGLDTRIGQRGTSLSGGQKQRLGIARAMITNPRLLVLDEATSSLDGQTEEEISSAIQRLNGDCTVIIIAHRLSTLRNSDKVIYISAGQIIAAGTLKQVREIVPQFDREASLSGL